jgi:hypothetical protein
MGVRSQVMQFRASIVRALWHRVLLHSSMQSNQEGEAEISKDA